MRLNWRKGMAMTSVMDMTDLTVYVACLMQIPSINNSIDDIPDEMRKYFYATCRLELARKRYNALLDKNGKLKSKVTEQEFTFYRDDLKKAENNIFTCDRK